MVEREEDPYWQLDLAIGEGHFYRDQLFTIRLRLHTSEEKFRDHQDLVPLVHKTGQRTYVLARPYILEPEITLTLGVYPKPTEQGAIAEVVGSDWVGFRHRDIGNAQAWYYPADRLLMVWECYLFEWCYQEDPRTDENLKALWTGFERHLLGQFPGTQQIVTPAWEDIYQRALWQEFLILHGYRPLTKGATSR